MFREKIPIEDESLVVSKALQEGDLSAGMVRLQLKSLEHEELL